MSRHLGRVLNAVSWLLVAAGAVLVVTILLQPFWSFPSAPEASSPEAEEVSQVSDAIGRSGSPGEAPVAPAAPESSSGGSGVEGGPENKTLRVSIPEMGRIEDDRVPSTAGNDEKALRKNVAIHLQGTGYPWQQEANVYMAGHRIGYPGTESFLGFFDLDKLEKGDRIHVRDAEGGRYTYRVFREEVVEPTDMTVTQPLAGRNILTLQTCTLPNYTQRLIVQAEKVA